MQNQSILSRTVSWLRFPLIVGVAFIHVSLSLPEGSQIDDFPVALEILRVVQSIVARIAVPLFFVISGFFFFRGGEFSKELYLKKIRSRAKTLLLPYLTWAALTFIAGVLWYGEPVSAMSFAKPLSANWHGFGHFWFIRELIICCAFSPIFFFVAKRWAWLPVFVCGVIVFARGAINLNPLIDDVIGTTSIFFFLLGATLAIEKIDFVEVCKKYAFPLATISVACAVWDLLSMDSGLLGWLPLAHNVDILFGMAAAVGLVARGIERGILRMPEFLSNATFFVFASHLLVGAATMKISARLIYGHFGYGSAQIVAHYFLCGAATILICLLVYAILKKIFPWSLPFLTGGR